MIVCPTCGHQNPPAFTVCSRCGAALPGGGADDMSRMMAEQDAAKRRNRMVYMVVGVLLVGVLGAYTARDRMTKAAITQKLQWLDQWAEKDKQEVGGLWNCLTQSNTPLDSFSNANQVQAKVEAAAMVQPKTFAQHLRIECVPSGERVVSTFEGMTEVPEEFAEGFTAYKASLPKLIHGIETYADRLEQHLDGADLASRIAAAGDEWHSSTSPTPDGIAFEKFLQCAVPGIAKIKGAQALLEVLAQECYKKDAGGFWQSVQDKCGSLLLQADPLAKPSPTFKGSMKKFYEPEQRMMSAWDDCARRGNKGRRDHDLTQFLHGFGEYMEARAQIARAAKALHDGA